jgi:hypothetical protein
MSWSSPASGGSADLPADLGSRGQLDLAGHSQRRGGRQQLRGVRALRHHLGTEFARDPGYPSGRGPS